MIRRIEVPSLTFAATMLIAVAAGAVRAQPAPFPDFAKPVWERSDSVTKVENERYLVIDDARAWAELWKQHAPGVAVPEIQFESAAVVCVFNPTWRKAGEAFGFERIVRGSLSSDLSSFNVMMSAAPATATKKVNRAAMILVDRTRLDFRFYAPRRHPKGKSKMVARVDPLAKYRPAASLREAADELIQNYHDATAEGQKKILAQVATMGSSILPHLHRRAAESSGNRDFWVIRKILDRISVEEAEARGKPVRHSEVALAKALAEVGRRIEVKGEPWYTEKLTRRIGDLWYVSLSGTFMIYSDMATASQKGVRAKVSLRARDGGIVSVEIRRVR